jgi:hypothetical protein
MLLLKTEQNEKKKAILKFFMFFFSPQLVLAKINLDTYVTLELRGQQDDFYLQHGIPNDEQELITNLVKRQDIDRQFTSSLYSNRSMITKSLPCFFNSEVPQNRCQIGVTFS